MPSLKLPFKLDNGSISVTSDANTIARQKIIDVLLTDTYERVMNHTYGAGSNILLFDSIDALEFADFKVEAMDALRTSISRVDIEDMFLSSPPPGWSNTSEGTTIFISVRYRLPLGTSRVLTQALRLPDFFDEESTI